MDFSRQQKLAFIGQVEQDKLAQSHIVVFGAGGLGCAALAYLATAGVGHIDVVDGDTVAEHNLHRQLLFTHEDIGKNKAQQSVQRLTELNPLGQYCAIDRFISASELDTLILSYDLVVDCTDDHDFSLQLNLCCLRLHKPAIFANASRMSGQLFNACGSHDDACLACLWGDKAPLMETCDGLGVLGPVPGVFGNLQAIEVIKFLVQHPSAPPLTNALLNFDFLSYQFQNLHVQRDPNCAHHKLALHNADRTIDHTSEIEKPNQQDTFMKASATYAKTLNQALEDGFTIIDITSIGERQQPLSVSHLHIPMDSLANQSQDHLDETTPYLFVCMSGKRSMGLQQFLVEQKGYENITAFVGQI